MLRRRRPSPAMVVALIALFVSLSGNAVAVTAYVTSKQIRDGTIQVRDLSAVARAQLKGNEGAQGPQGTRGFTGTQGAQGLPGLPGPPGARGPEGLQGQQGLPGATFSTFTLESDMRKLCNAIGETQRELDEATTGFLFFIYDLRYSGCFYSY